MLDVQTGTIQNIYVGNSDPHPLLRLTIGIVGTNGKVAEIVFERDDESGMLVAQLPPEQPWLPTEEDITIQYLQTKGWERIMGAEYAIFIDSISLQGYNYLEACEIQNERDTREELEVKNLTGELSFEDTPLALEVYSGE